MMRRFVRDESGMTMGLALIMIVLIGVMGAGLLTFASKDLDTVVEVNRGQRAFELADAGVGVAIRQLTDDCAGDIDCTQGYDLLRSADGSISEPGGSAPDIQWSWLRGGVTLRDLDGSGTTTDRVHVTIDYQAGPDHFKIISTSTYGAPTDPFGVQHRKIEALLRGISGTFGGEGIGHPLYFTPSDITIEGDPDAAIAGDQTQRIELSGISMFSEGDIVIEGFDEAIAGDPDCSTKQGNNPPQPILPPFRADFEVSGCGVFHVPNTKDVLEDWDTTRWDPPKPRGEWNTVGREGMEGYEPQCQNSTKACERPGFAAEGRICAVPEDSPIGKCSTVDPLTGTVTTRPSIADGVYAYDCTTGPVASGGCERVAGESTLGKGNLLNFVEKQQEVDPDTGNLRWGQNDPGTITYPFPKLVPKEKRLAAIAEEQEAEGGGGDYYRSSPTLDGCRPPWETLMADATPNSVYFIDLGDCVDGSGNPLPVPMDMGGTKDGIVVAWCGDLVQTNDTKFRGILMNLHGDGSEFASSNCSEDDPMTTEDDAMKRGVYRLEDGSEMWGWLYSEGGTPTRSGIELAAGTQWHFRSGATWNFLDDAFSGIPPTGFAIRSWRECYQLEENAIENALVC